ncbi:MAG: SDR family oxidoreductase [Lentisphaerae bacterium]|nr:SDR family oxidoreductase [Lentisphaerota bacterium]
MIEHGGRYLVMGLLSPGSLAWAIGQTVSSLGGKVFYTVQNETLKKRYLDSSRELSDSERAGLEVVLCDVADEKQVESAVHGAAPLAGVVHSVAYANPKTCLGDEFHTDAKEDILRSYEVSCVSLAAVARHAAKAMPDGGSIVALSFDTTHAYAGYNWMGVHKSALESLVRHLARRHGRDGIRVNAVSAGPVFTPASSKIPGFETILDAWKSRAPLGWDPSADKQAVADAVAFLLGPRSTRITGQVLAVDGGAAIVGGELLGYERPPAGNAPQSTGKE